MLEYLLEKPKNLEKVGSTLDSKSKTVDSPSQVTSTVDIRTGSDMIRAYSVGHVVRRRGERRYEESLSENPEPKIQ